MSSVFIDTSFLLALVYSDDELHERALAWQKILRRPMLTTDFVILELADAMCAAEDRALAIATIDILRKNVGVQILPASESLFASGYEIFRSRPDKAWSLTDCISFSAMATHDMNEALTHDHHFAQAGFIALLRSDPSAA